MNTENINRGAHPTRGYESTPRVSPSIEDIITLDQRGDVYGHIERLQEACAWAGLSQGRATGYASLIREMVELWDDRVQQEEIWRDRLLAYNESGEIVDIHDCWATEVGNFPGLLTKIRKTFKKGPLFQEEENPHRATNQPRNDAFVILLAGRLIRAGLPVISVDGIPRSGFNTCPQNSSDIVIEQERGRFVIECKRPQTKDAIGVRVEEARDQVHRGRYSFGIAALDLSACIRPPATLLSVTTSNQASSYVADLIQEAAEGAAARIFDDPFVAGLWTFARVPAMTHRVSIILSHNGKPFRIPTPYSVKSSVLKTNDNSPDRGFFKTFRQYLRTSSN